MRRDPAGTRDSAIRGRPRIAHNRSDTGTFPQTRETGGRPPHGAYAYSVISGMGRTAGAPPLPGRIMVGTQVGGRARSAEAASGGPGDGSRSLGRRPAGSGSATGLTLVLVDDLLPDAAARRNRQTLAQGPGRGSLCSGRVRPPAPPRPRPRTRTRKTDAAATRVADLKIRRQRSSGVCWRSWPTGRSRMNDRRARTSPSLAPLPPSRSSMSLVNVSLATRQFLPCYERLRSKEMRKL